MSIDLLQSRIIELQNENSLLTHQLKITRKEVRTLETSVKLLTAGLEAIAKVLDRMGDD